ncbi:MAG: hypothetical protein GY803_29340 [Chloroflexi bacterium]|nr:hypothetical protein [Chloroflexota bacterium]
MSKKPTTANIMPKVSLSATAVIQLEDEGKLVCILQPEIKARLQRLIATSASETRPYLVESGDQVYISIADIENETQRRRVHDLIQRYQIGLNVDLSGLPNPLRQLLQPQPPTKTLRALAFCGMMGLALGILAMAVSILAIAAVELALQVTLDEFSGMQITAVSFVIFSVLGWILAVALFSCHSRR